MYTQILKNLGLSENEIKVYIALLELGTCKVNSISNRVPLPRTTIYGLLKSLIERGMVSYVIKAGVKHYEATDPRRLLLVEQEKITELKNVIPKLEKLKQTIGEKPLIEMYEGKEGIKSIYEDMLRIKQTICGYGNTKLLFELLEYYVPNYIKRRVKLGIKFYVITEKSKTAKDMKKNDKKEKRKTRFIEEMENMTIVTYLYGRKMAIMGLLKKQPFGIIIENEGVYKSNKITFDIMWKMARS